jgi:ABC-type branched-subunit amino acid transport system substrate-binding protein
VKANSAVEGTILVDTPVLNPENTNAKAFLGQYRADFGQDPPYFFLAGASYDQIKLLAQAIEKAGLEADDVSKYLYALNSYDGTIGSFSFDATGDVEGIDLTLKQVKDGALVEVK